MAKKKNNYNLGIRFEKVVENHLTSPALIFSKDISITYEELNSKANQFARLLQSLGIGQNDVLCVSGEKEPDTFALMLASLKLGAIYSILDPESPIERLRKIVERCEPKLLFSDARFGAAVSKATKDISYALLDSAPDALKKKLDGFDQTNLPETRKVVGTSPAYIMFTSGSTGFPKGAVMTHDNLSNLINWSRTTFNFTPDDILTNVNPLYFDNTVFDFYSSLFSGASLVPVSKETATHPKSLINLIDELKCTSWFSVPSLLMYLQSMKSLNKDNMSSIKRFIFGGEGYPKGKLKDLFDLYSDRCELINVYGPTECTCMCSSYRISSDDFSDLLGFPPLGEIADNFSYLILNDFNRRVDEDEVGELCLLGPSVGKGYYNDPERTNEHFIQNPYQPNFVETTYKTGDLVKLSSEDGKIHIMGRKDHQIKHMGYRIELEEIETALCSLSYVSHAAVIHGVMSGLSQIIAIVCTDGKEDKKAIKDDLKEIIPHYMIPTKVHFESELPTNPNGKVDRRKLAEIHLAKK